MSGNFFSPTNKASNEWWKRKESKWKTRKAHLKINKVSVDFLIFSLMARHFFHCHSFFPSGDFLMTCRKEKDFIVLESFVCPKSVSVSFIVDVVAFLSAENVSWNIEKSNYWDCSWTRRQIKLNCLLCETKRRKKVKSLLKTSWIFLCFHFSGFRPWRRRWKPWGDEQNLIYFS